MASFASHTASKTKVGGGESKFPKPDEKNFHSEGQNHYFKSHKNDDYANTAGNIKRQMLSAHQDYSRKGILWGSHHGDDSAKRGRTHFTFKTIFLYLTVHTYQNALKQIEQSSLCVSCGSYEVVKAISSHATKSAGG